MVCMLQERSPEMQRNVKSKAEEQFAAVQKKDRTALKAKEKALKEQAEHTAHLRAQRLAKEAADREAAKK
jgi:cytochrome c biogenesis protein ResB